MLKLLTTVAIFLLIIFIPIFTKPQESNAWHRPLSWWVGPSPFIKFPTPTSKPSLTPMPTITPTVRPTSTPTPRPTSTLIPSQVEVSKHTFIMNQINEYRRSKGLSDVATDKYTCDFAKIRAVEISSSFNHKGFSDRVNNKTLPYPSYRLITENIAMNSDYKDVVPSWISSSGHAENMRKDTSYVCVEYSGNYYAYEGWKP